MIDFLEKVFEKLTNNLVIGWFSSHKWYTLGFGIALFGLVIIIFQRCDVATEGRINYLLAVPLAALIICGVGLVLLSFNTESMGGFGVKVSGVKGKRKFGKQPNTINIVVRKNRNGENVPAEIFFSRHKRPMGQLHKLENDGKYYYVHILDLKTKKMIDLVLPDTMYLDPRKYVIPLTMPADEAYWKPTIPTWQKFSTGALVVTIIIEWIVYTTTRGG